MIIGILAGTLTTGCWVPQVIKSLRTRKVDEFSWIYLMAGFLGIGLWFVYGILKSDLEIWLANGLTDFAVLVLLLLKVATSVRGHGQASPDESSELGETLRTQPS